MSLGPVSERVEPNMHAPELVLREDDLARLDRLVQGLLQERLSAVVVADDEGLLDHYGRLFSARLREQTAVKIEVYFPNSTEAVLARFNRILADLKVSDAISPTGSSAEHRVLVVYDGQATDLREVQLLGRLLRDFPGANTRLLMLLNRNGLETEQKVEALGKRVLRWDLHRPTPDEARQLLERARTDGKAPEAQALLDSVGVQGLEEAMALRAGLSALAKADAALGPLGTPAQAAASFAASLQRAAEQNRAPTPPPAPVAQAATTPSPGAGLPPATPVAESSVSRPPAKKRSRFSPLLLAGLVALSASAALTAWQHLGDRLTQALLPADTAALEPGAAASKAGATPPNTAGLKTLGPLPEQVSNEELLEARRNAPLPAEPEPAPAPVKAEPPKPEPPKPEPPKPEPPKPEPAKPEPVKGDPADMRTVAPGFYVQHASRETRAEALDYFKSNPGLAKARLLKLKRIGAQGDNFVLLSGPFKTLDEARAFTQRPGIPKDTWIRPASALKKLLPEATQ